MTEHELGPALVFSHDPDAVRFDHYLRQRAGGLTIELKISLIRQIAEALKYAHGKHIVHRALSPQSIMVRDGDSEPPLQTFHWMAGDYDQTTSAYTQTCSLHLDQLVDYESMVYLSPEAARLLGSEHLHFAAALHLGGLTFRRDEDLRVAIMVPSSPMIQPPNMVPVVAQLLKFTVPILWQEVR